MITTLPLLCAALAAGATGVDSLWDRVPAETRWVAHIDLKAALNSKLFTASLNGPLQMTEEIEEFQAQIGLNPLEDIYSVTVYSAADRPEQAVALFHTSGQVETALERLRQHLTCTSAEIEGMEVQRWSEGSRDDEPMYSYLARRQGGGDCILVASQLKDELIRGVQVLRGEAKSLAQSQSPAITASPSEGAFFFAAASEGLADLAGMEAASSVARLAKSLVFEAGERGDRTFLHLTVTARSKPDAKRITAILQGASALAGLVAETERDMLPVSDLMQHLRFHSEGSDVSIQFEYDSRELVALLQERAGLAGGVRRPAPKPEPDSAVPPKAKPKKKWYQP